MKLTLELSPVLCTTGSTSHTVEWTTVPAMYHNGELAVIGHMRGDCVDCGLDGF